MSLSFRIFQASSEELIRGEGASKGAMAVQGKVKLSDFNILWRSPAVPQDPFVYSGKLCDPIKKAIRSTFLDLGNDPGAKKFLDNLKSSKFVAMSDKDYDVIRTLAKAKAEFKKKNKK